MVRWQLDERQWSKVAAIVETQRGAGRLGKDDRNFIEAVLWWRRTGVPWRDLPEAFGPWKTVFNRFDRWSNKAYDSDAIGEDLKSRDALRDRAESKPQGAPSV